MALLFISQERLDAWTAENRVSLDGSVLTLNDDGRAFDIRPAVRFLTITGADSDPNALLGKVKDEESLVEMGGEVYMDSVILGDVAYDVQPGFLGDPQETTTADAAER